MGGGSPRTNVSRVFGRKHFQGFVLHGELECECHFVRQLGESVGVGK